MRPPTVNPLAPTPRAAWPLPDPPAAPRRTERAEMVGLSPAMRRLFRCLEEAGRSQRPVLITGETGAGKSLAARVLHGLWAADVPFLAVDAAGFDERFGRRLAAGRPAPAALFLEEVGDFPEPAQRRLAGILAAGTGLRLFASTSRDLRAAEARGELRRGLYDRLCGFVVRVPSLRERRDDLPLLLGHFLDEWSAAYGKRIPGVRPDAMELLLAHPWPGNVRELRNEVERAVVLTPDGEEVQRGVLSPDLAAGPARPVAGRVSALRQRSREIERSLVARTLERHGWNVSATARELGISRVGLSKKLRVLEMQRPAAAGRRS